jgi:hypothetical protein
VKEDWSEMRLDVLKQSLAETGKGRMKIFGHSMEPLVKHGSVLDFAVSQWGYELGDVVFCKVRGRYLVHKITKKRLDGDHYEYLISNNKGHDNGWTGIIYGKVI